MKTNIGVGFIFSLFVFIIGFLCGLSVTKEKIVEKEVEVIRYETEWKEVMRTEKYYECMDKNGEYKFQAQNPGMGIDWEETCTY